MKFEPLTMTAVDSQLIDQLRWSAETVCSTFHVPPWKAHVGAQPAYTKPEIANQVYYSDCLQSLIEQWELCMDEGLGLDEPVGDGERKRVLGVELDLQGLLRMDTASQVDTLVAGIQGGLFTPNGARRRIDEKPVKGGDTIWLQQQDVPIEVAFENAHKPPPAPMLPPPPPTVPDPDEEEESEEETRALLDLYTKAIAA
jgi:phage portal protein BeeE